MAGENVNYRILARLEALEAAEAACMEPVLIVVPAGTGFIITSGTRKGEAITAQEGKALTGKHVVIIMDV